MSELKDIVQVQITRATKSVTRAGFGTFGIISEFATNKTTTAFGRYRNYSSLAEVSADGWTSYDAVYKAAQKVFSQNPSVSKIMVGRADALDADLATSLAAIAAASNDWYAFTVVGANTLTVTFAGDFITGNSIVATLNGVPAASVSWTTSMQNTMGLLETAIEAAVTGAVVTVGSTPYRTLTITVPNKISSVSFAITGGASQTTYTVASASTVSASDVEDVADWTETEKKLYFYNTVDPNTLDAGQTSDIGYILKGKNYDRSVGMYYATDPDTFIESGWCGEALPYDPGSQTWAYKTIAGVSAYSITSGQRTAALGKNVNIYTEVAGVSITEEGKVASGEYIDIMRGTDWLEARLMEDVYAALVNSRKIPFTDSGITLIEGIVKGVLNEAANAGVLVKESIVLTVPKASDVSAADKSARLLPDIDFTATYQGAIHKVSIAGTISL